MEGGDQYELDWSVRNVILENCTSSDWSKVFLQLSQLECVNGVGLKNCNLSENDLVPLTKMEHLEKLSLGTLKNQCLDSNLIRDVGFLRERFPRLRLLSVGINI
jgi:hypothetical protein